MSSLWEEGLQGLSAAMKLARKRVRTLSYFLYKSAKVPLRTRTMGINIAINLKGEDDSPIIHAYDTIKGGDFLANQPPSLEMCLAAPAIITTVGSDWMPFNRTIGQGHLDFSPDSKALLTIEPLFAALPQDNSCFML